VVFSFILLFAQNVYSAQVTLAWDPNTEPDIAEYVIYTGSSSRAYDVSVDVGNQTTYRLSGLADRQTYYFAVTANADTDGDGIDNGDEVAYWGDSWYADYDGDGLINLSDPDADGDSVTDGEEINQGFDPADSNSKPQLPYRILRHHLKNTSGFPVAMEICTAFQMMPGMLSILLRCP
jgi:hypothetical protein